MAEDNKDLMTRRKLLTKLGFAAGVAYVAPTFAGHDVARASTPSASSPSGPSGPSGSSAPSAPSAPSVPSGPSEPSVPSVPSVASGPSGVSGPSCVTDGSGFTWSWDMETMSWVCTNPAP